MSETIETRLAKIERDLAILKSRGQQDKSNWINDIIGAARNDPNFDEIVRLGKEERDAERPEEN